MSTTAVTLPRIQKNDSIPEKPEKGLKGLKYWKQDLLAGLVVSFVATPVSIGIAIASGAPPIAGLISAVVAGFVLPLIGGSYVTISGPAAGLAPAIYAAILSLSHGGNMEQGFKLLLPVIFIVGLVQMVLSRLKVAQYSKIFPLPVIEGMMASIGLMIIFKQIPLLIGHKFLAHEFWGIVLETPSELLKMEPVVFGVGLFSLLLIIVLYSFRNRSRFLQTFPPQLITVIVGTILGQAFLLNKKFLINLPGNPLANAMHVDNFTALFAHPGLLNLVPVLVITLTLIDGIESLATISAVDKIDPDRRQSNPDRTLLAMGASNLCSSLAGGLTLIPEILRSSTNILVGGRTQWANFFCAFFVLTYLLLFRNVISMIPLTVLSAVVLYTGYTLCKPSLWKKIYNNGTDQFLIFLWTIFITVTFDLMWGILSGVVVAVLMNTGLVVYRTLQSAGRPIGWLEALMGNFSNPVDHTRQFSSAQVALHVEKPVLCTNVVHIFKMLSKLPESTKQVDICFAERVHFISIGLRIQ